jgi:DedD protein
MPPPIGDDELKLKQRARRRLIGAIALLAALVILLPMMLDREPKRPQNDIAVHIPAPQQTPATPDPAPAESAPLVEPKSEPVSAAPEPVEIKPEPAPAAAETPAPVLTVKPAATGSYFVQVGVFSKTENAKSVQTKLAKNKLAAIADSVKTPGGARTRVRIGPFASRDAAGEILSRVKRAGEKNATIVKVERSH